MSFLLRGGCGRLSNQCMNVSDAVLTGGEMRKTITKGAKVFRKISLIFATVLAACGGGEEVVTDGALANAVSASIDGKVFKKRNEQQSQLDGEHSIKMARAHGKTLMPNDASKQKHNARHVENQLIVGLMVPLSGGHAAKTLMESGFEAWASMNGIKAQPLGRTAKSAKGSTKKASTINSDSPKYTRSVFLLDVGRSDKGLDEWRKLIQSRSDVEYVEYNYIRRAQAVNDPGFSNQWYVNPQDRTFTYSYFADTASASLQTSSLHSTRASELWDEFQFQETVVAVIDAGVKLDHEDIADKIFENVGEVDGNGIDDDGNGYIDDKFGFNVYSNRGNGAVSVDVDGSFNSHGTAIAALIGATHNNGKGIAGVNPAAKILPIVATNSSGGLAISESLKAMEYLRAMKLKGVPLTVVNISFAGFEYSQAERDALLDLNEVGVLVVSSAGNETLNTNVRKVYPGSYQTPNLINVGASDGLGAASWFSNYGVDVDIFAPGEGLYTAYGNGYGWVRGTSFSAPLVAGAASLLWSIDSSIGVGEVRQRILTEGYASASTTNYLFQIDSPSGLHLSAAYSARNVSCPESPYGYFRYPFSRRDVWTVKASHKVEVIARHCGQTSIVVNYDAENLNVELKDNGVYPDEAVGDGIWTGIIRPSTDSQGTLSASTSKGHSIPSHWVYVNEAMNYRQISRTNDFTVWMSSPTWEKLNLEAVSDSVSVLDEGYVRIDTPFSIFFAGMQYDKIVVTTNGKICIGDTSYSCAWYDGDPALNFDFASVTQFNAGGFPSGKNHGEGVGVISAWMADLKLMNDSASGIYTRVSGTAPNRRFTIRWRGMIPWNSTSTSSGEDFAVAFYENQSYFDLQYLSLSRGRLYHGVGGVQHLNGQHGFQYVKNSSSMQSEPRLFLENSHRIGPVGSSFNDVSAFSVFATDFEALRGARITTGCGASNPNGYCPADPVTRWMMAAFVQRAKRGHDDIGSYTSPQQSPFNDVPTTHAFYHYIAGMREDGITRGCGPANPGGYCPDDAVTREQMATFLVRALKGSGYLPPGCSGSVFLDVNCNSGLSRYVNEFERMGITSGYGVPGGREYRPFNQINRAEMAAFLQRAFRFYDYW